MSIQAALNQQAIDMLPKVKDVISNAEPFESNQIEHLTLRECMNSSTPIDQMSRDEIEEFQDGLISVFKHYKWVL